MEELLETVVWYFDNFSPAEEDDGDDRYYYGASFYGVDYFMDIYVTDGRITDHTCSRYMGESLGYLYESDFEVPEAIYNDVMERENARMEAQNV